MTDTDQTDTRPEPDPIEQREQAAALAASLLGRMPRPEGADPIDLTDVVGLANWLLTGRHPLERISSGNVTRLVMPGWTVIAEGGGAGGSGRGNAGAAGRVTFGSSRPAGQGNAGRPLDGLLTDDLPEPVDATIVCGASSAQYELTCGLPDGHQPFRLAEPGHLPKTWEHATGEHGGMAWEGTAAVTFTGGITYLQAEDVPLFPHQDQPAPARFTEAEVMMRRVLVDRGASDTPLTLMAGQFNGRLYLAPIGSSERFGPWWQRAAPLCDLPAADREPFEGADTSDRRMPF